MAPFPRNPSFGEALRFWAKLGWIAFGGPTGQIAILHEELVERRGWIAEADFLQGLNYCLMLPGPEAQQLVTYLGWRLHGVRGALAAGILFFLPAMVLLWGLSVVYVMAGSVPALAAAFYGLGPPVLAIILRALLHLARRTVKSPADLLIAAGAAVLMMVFPGDYPLVVLLALLCGLGLYRKVWDPAGVSVPATPIAVRPLLGTTLACLVAWWAPLFLAWLLLGRANTIVAEGFFFTKAALVTFGGAYVVLPYVTQHAVVLHHWLGASDMLHGIALASTIPGPLVILNEFVAFVGAWRSPGTMAPLGAATLAALLSTWVTFAPSFLYILVGGPVIQRVVQVRFLRGALRAISAAVVGVMIDFALWFGGRLVFPARRLDHPDLFVILLAAAALLALTRFRVSVPLLLVAGAVLGMMYQLILRPAG